VTLYHLSQSFKSRNTASLQDETERKSGLENALLKGHYFKRYIIGKPELCLKMPIFVSTQLLFTPIWCSIALVSAKWISSSSCATWIDCCVLVCTARRVVWCSVRRQ